MIGRWRDALIAWLRRVLIDPAIHDVLSRMKEEQSLTRAHLAAAHQEFASRMIGELRSLRHEVRLLNDELVSRPATAEQMDRFNVHLLHLDDQVAHLAALMFGKSVAETIRTNRGPRAFTQDDRQWHG